MKFVGLLGPENCIQEEKKSIFADFNLNVCISKINSLVKGYDLLEMYTRIPKERETIQYRRQITKDMQSEVVREAFSNYALQIEDAKKKEQKSQYNNHYPQKCKWHLDALVSYTEAIQGLYEVLGQQDNLSKELSLLVDYLKQYQNDEAYSQWYQNLVSVNERLKTETITFSIQKNKIVLEENIDCETFRMRMERAFSVKQDEANKHIKDKELSRVERALSERILKRSGLENSIDSLMNVSMNPILLQLATDVQYYLGFYKFVEFMNQKGYTFCLPKEGESMSVMAGYDAAMAVKSEDIVVSNDFSMENGESFFVITGANGGGKTTFARMIGQILYFNTMGLLVPCEKAVIPHFSDVMSHFSNEEIEASGRGKLVEELTRLKPMMSAHNENAFVILNELFTTAATYDAGIMGQKVLEHFMQMNCRGIYVTHIQALAEEREGIVSMVAELEKDHRTRSFKISRKPAKEGEYEDSLITRYHMTYEQMKAVMRDED